LVALVAMPPCYATSEREVHTSHDKYKASSSDTSHAWTSDGRTPAEVAGVHVMVIGLENDDLYQSALQS